MNLVSIPLPICLGFLAGQLMWRGAAGFPQANNRGAVLASWGPSGPFVGRPGSTDAPRAATTTRLGIRPEDDVGVPTADSLLSTLRDLIAQAPKNGIGTPDHLERQILGACRKLEEIAPYRSPTRTPGLLDGFWHMLWTNYGPPGPSCGKLGPFVGDVYQDLRLTRPDDRAAAGVVALPPRRGEARNIFKLAFPPVAAELLLGEPAVVDDTTVAVTFRAVGARLAGRVPLGPDVEFEPGGEVRLWDHAYVDSTYRILYARDARSDNSGRDGDGDGGVTDPTRGFLYVMKRADGDRLACAANIF